jgi:putative phosphoribosyl transferase
MSSDTIPPLGLPAFLSLPGGARGLVVFAHGSGSGRMSPRNRQVAVALQEQGLATLLFDLLLPEEAADRRKVFDIPLLASRLEDAVRWVGAQEQIATLPLGLFGASTGAAAALVAASRAYVGARAIVSRGGRPDLAASELGLVEAPTLLIVGGADEQVLALNRAAMPAFKGPVELEVVAGAGHLFEEPGALEEVTRLATGWFLRHLPEASGGPGTGWHPPLPG